MGVGVGVAVTERRRERASDAIEALSHGKRYDSSRRDAALRDALRFGVASIVLRGDTPEAGDGL